MTEAEWLACTDPTPMLEFLGDKASHRKRRLFVLACYRQVWASSGDDACCTGYFRTPCGSQSMAHRQIASVLRCIHPFVAGHPLREQSDSELLERFATRRDQAAFTALVQRHGLLVLSVGRQVLQDEHRAEDVFQATFLVRARKAAAIHRGQALASWLYHVACRLAARARCPRSFNRGHACPRAASASKSYPRQGRRAHGPGTEARV
jgi:hypothetical protein